jgi:hypothetical protein
LPEQIILKEASKPLQKRNSNPGRKFEMVCERRSRKGIECRQMEGKSAGTSSDVQFREFIVEIRDLMENKNEIHIQIDATANGPPKIKYERFVDDLMI